jgi:hypothetical protein
MPRRAALASILVAPRRLPSQNAAMEITLPVTDVVLQFAIVLAAALAVQLTFEHSRVPGVVGLLLLGMVIGPGGLAVLPQEPVVELLGSIASSTSCSWPAWRSISMSSAATGRQPAALSISAKRHQADFPERRAYVLANLSMARPKAETTKRTCPCLEVWA